MIENRPLRVFLCHSSKDNSIARELYHQLDGEGWVDVWFIEARLLPSQDWGTEITKGIENADVIIAFLSKNTPMEEETDYPAWSFVVDVLKVRDDEKVFILPLLLDDSNISIDLKIGQSINYFPKNQRKMGYQKLLENLEAYAGQLGLSLDKQLAPPAPEQRMQWTPSLWKQLDEKGFEVEAESKPPNSRSIRTGQRFRKFFSGVNDLFFLASVTGTLLVISVCALTINYLVKGDNTNFITAPIVSRALTLVPLPTPTLGVGSVRISPKDGMRMVYVPAGEFLMGSEDHQDDEQPVHNVYVDAFWIDQYEVTNGMYAQCVEAKICTMPIPEEILVELSPKFSDQILFRSLAEQSEFPQRLATDPEFFNQPVTGIFWENANAYCQWVGRRLPTEAEWEKAARGVDGRMYPSGEEIDCTKANLFSCADNPSRVGSFEAGQSPYGAYDMAGNAMEWVADWYGSSYYQISPYENPLGPTSGLHRVYRGGSWESDEFASRAANRPGYSITIPHNLIGYRCASSE